MRNIDSKKAFIAKNLILIIFSLQILACTRRVPEKPITAKIENEVSDKPPFIDQITTFPQIHSNLNGMVREFVRAMHQDKNGNYWFGTNGDGIIRYDGKILEKISIQVLRPFKVVREIVEDKEGNLWFGTDNGLVKYDGKNYTSYTIKDGFENDEIWGLTIDKNGLIWVGSIGGVSHFDGQKFTPFLLPDTKVENSKPMLSSKLVFKFLEDRNGTMWFVTDGNGIFKYKNGEFVHLTAKNGLTDNSVADILEDKQGNIWIGTFYGGVSKYDGKTYTNFTKEGVIEGIETYNFCEDRQGNIWFSAEGYGVYRYDGANFTQFTTANGLTTDVVQSIYEDKKGQLWFGTWQGISIYDGQKFMNAKDKEPWTK
jgi:ligand-binding sensor domain-containing protein